MDIILMPDTSSKGESEINLHEISPQPFVKRTVILKLIHTPFPVLCRTAEQKRAIEIVKDISPEPPPVTTLITTSSSSVKV